MVYMHAIVHEMQHSINPTHMCQYYLIDAATSAGDFFPSAAPLPAIQLAKSKFCIADAASPPTAPAKGPLSCAFAISAFVSSSTANR